VHVTEPSNASRTLLFDIRTLAWSPDLCELFGVVETLLPEVRPSSGRLGVTATGLPVAAGLPISGVLGDQQAALFGQACLSPGLTKNTYGTGSFVLMNVGEHCPEPVEGLLTTVAWTLEGRPGATYALEGSIFVTGAAVQWLRDGLGLIRESAEVGPLAESVSDSGGVVVVPAFTGLGSPWWDPYARGTIVGITRGTQPAHLARAVVEAMAFSTRDVVDAMTAASGQAIGELRVDGGASAMDLLLQVQADQLQVPVARPVVQETTALGAAYVAGLAEEVWSSPDEVASRWSLDRRCDPHPRDPSDTAFSRWQRAITRSRNWSR
jgi:glycerol kinase